MKRLWYQLIILVTFLLFWGIGIFYAEYIAEHNQFYSIYYPDKNINQKDIMSKIKPSGVKLRFINYLEQETITSTVSGEDSRVTVIEAFSNMEQLKPFELLYGEELYTDDNLGCVLDKESAFRVFGTMRAVGNKLNWNGHEYIVRGVADSEDSFLLVYEPDAMHSYQNIEILFGKEAGADNIINRIKSNKAAEFSEAYIDKAPEVIVDRKLIGGFLKLLCLLPAYFFILWFIAAKGIRWYRKWKVIFLTCKKPDRMYQNRFKVKALGYLLLFIAAYLLSIFLLLWTLNMNQKVPMELVPNGWSNFKSYLYGLKEMTGSITCLGNERLFFDDLLIRTYAFRCIICVGITIIAMLLWFAARRRTLFSIKPHFTTPIFVTIIIFALVIILDLCGLEISLPRYYWFLLPCLMALEELDICIYKRVK